VVLALHPVTQTEQAADFHLFLIFPQLAAAAAVTTQVLLEQTAHQGGLAVAERHLAATAAQGHLGKDLLVATLQTWGPLAAAAAVALLLLAQTVPHPLAALVVQVLHLPFLALA